MAGPAALTLALPLEVVFANQHVIEKDELAPTMLHDDDVVEVVNPVGGVSELIGSGPARLGAWIAPGLRAGFSLSGPPGGCYPCGWRGRAFLRRGRLQDAAVAARSHGVPRGFHDRPRMVLPL